MGFIPIFITLGGFVFLFLMLVNQNLKNKRRSFLFRVEALKQRIAEVYPGSAIPPGADLAALEKSFVNARNAETSITNDQATEQIKSEFAACKMARFQYQQLRATKPYSYVALLFGHKDI